MKIRKLLFRLLFVALLVTFLTSGRIVVRYVIDSVQQKKEYDELAAMVAHSRENILQETEPKIAANMPVPEQTVPPTTPPEPTIPVILPEYLSAYGENPDLVGWMVIDGTSINYPVMQTPDRTDYYLKRNFKGDYSEHGCLYVRESCDVFTPSDNLTIYGHHMSDGSMFASLDNFRFQSFWEAYQTIHFDTLYERHTYTVFAVFVTTASAGEGFAYHLFENAADQTEFDEFVATCKALSDYDTGITPQYGDKIICLSTCEYSQFNGRLVVAAVRD